MPKRKQPIVKLDKKQPPAKKQRTQENHVQKLPAATTIQIEKNDVIAESFASPTESQQVITQFHTLNKYLESVQHDPKLSQGQKLVKAATIREQMQQMGGLDKYQQASVFGESTQHYKAFNSAQWIIDFCKHKQMDQNVPASKWRVLDVGALTNHFLAYDAWLVCSFFVLFTFLQNVTPIDLQPQHESVIKADFFDFTQQQGNTTYDMIVLSLVLNFVGDPRKRMTMLQQCAKSLPLQSGLLFIVLPLACIENSRYMNHDLFVQILHAVGFDCVQHKNSAKLAFFVLQRTKKQHANKEQLRQLGKRQVLRQGASRNNFAILFSQ